MEKKTTQRIIGIMVVGSLVIIALPLFLGKNDASEKAAAAARSTPTVQVAEAPAASSSPMNLPTDGTQTTATQETTTTETATETTTQPAPSAAPVQTPPTSENTAASPTQEIKAAEPVPTAPTTPVIPQTQEPAQPQQTTINTSDNNSAELSQQVINSAQNKTTVEESATAVKKSFKSNSALPKHTSAHAQTAAHKLHEAAWVVQMGSFKNKDNAKRLTNQLRAAGFKAFMSTAKNSDKERTRVLVGPEYKQASATQISNRVNQAIKMKGIIVPYKPLAI